MPEEIMKKIDEITEKMANGCDYTYLEEQTEFIEEVCEHYDKINKSASDDRLKTYLFIGKFYLTYLAKKYGMNFKYDLFSTDKTSNFDPSTNKISIVRKMIFHDSDMVLGVLLHELRHKMQFDFQKCRIDDICKIDPATILFIKEVIAHSDYDLYTDNHDCFLKEHDANLFAIAESKKFADPRIFEMNSEGESNNYIAALLGDTDLSDFEYHTKQKLPVVYEEDCRLKKFMAHKRVDEGSLLSLIYNSDGTPKSYEELLRDKEHLIEKHRGQIVDIRSDSTNYHQDSHKSAEQHINQIYKLIIASDPILNLEEFLHRYNDAEGLYKQRWSKKAKSLLDNCPQLCDLYSKELTDIFIKEVSRGNTELVQNVLGDLSNTSAYTKINLYIKSKQNKKKDDPDDGDDGNYMEKLPFGMQTPTLHRPTISDAVKKQVLLNKKKKEFQEQKQQLLNQERIIRAQEEQEAERRQEIIAQEEDHGMIM